MTEYAPFFPALWAWTKLLLIPVFAVILGFIFLSIILRKLLRKKEKRIAREIVDNAIRLSKEAKK